MKNEPDISPSASIHPMYSQSTIKNKSAIKRFSHSRRFKIALDILRPNDGESVLDYGTGDGYFLLSLKRNYPKIKIFGYEPVPVMFSQLASLLNEDEENTEITITQELEALEANSFEKITCFEVLEHFDENIQRIILGHLKSFLKRNGTILISVPIEVGFSSLIKNILRLMIKQSHRDANLQNVIKSLLGVSIEREKGSYIYTHLGFYYFDLEKVIREEGLIINKKICSPFRILGTFINSQVFYLVSLP